MSSYTAITKKIPYTGSYSVLEDLTKPEHYWSSQFHVGLAEKNSIPKRQNDMPGIQENDSSDPNFSTAQ